MATTFRALVMLAVLVGLPAAWIYYGPLPPEAQQVVDRFVGAAKETLGLNKPSPHQRADSADVDYAPPPAWNATEAAPPSTAPQPSPAAPVEAPALVSPKAPTFAEQVAPLLARLRQLGAAAYDLELWGDGGQLYRFHCEMPLAEGAQLTQQFEAVAADPQESVAQVVAQVSQWQLGRQHAGM